VLTCFGMTHRDAPLDVRERLSIGGDDVAPLVKRASRELGPAAILSTCGRLELYVVGEIGRDALIRTLSESAGLPSRLVAEHFDVVRDGDVVRHLFGVAAGIDSMILGEPEILSQVRAAHAIACDVGAADSLIDELFVSAIRAGRRARSTTGIAQQALSISSIAAFEAVARHDRHEGMQALVIGAGEAGRCAAEALVDRGVRDLTIANRTFEHAGDLARGLSARAIPFERLRDELACADVAIAASGSVEPIVGFDDLEPIARGREERPLLIVDIAVPRDFEPRVARLPNVVYLDLEDLRAISERNGSARKAELPKARAIVEEEAQRFEGWLRLREVIPTITALTEKAEHIRRAQLRKTLRTLGPSAEVEDRVEALTRALVKRILHHPIMAIRHPDYGEEHARAVQALFNLGEPAPIAADDP
jgi:glutamyl-tRNA reductase